MYEELLGYIKKVENQYLRQVLEYYFVKDETFIRNFKGHSAAKTVHHGFAGGLLEHTLSVVKFCDYMVGAYPILNKDLLFTAAICHDIGKTKELSSFPENDYTDEGQLLGHIVIGVEMIGDAVRNIPDFPEKLANELKTLYRCTSRRTGIRFTEETGTCRGDGTESCRQCRCQDADTDRVIQR